MSFLLRNAPLIRQRLFTSSARTRNLLSIEDAATAQFTHAANTVPKLGRIAKWYLPTCAAIAFGMLYLPKSLVSPAPPATRRTVTLPAATANIGFGVTTALDEANRAVHAPAQMTQEQKNLALMDAYGARNSLEDMERALAGLEASGASEKSRNARLEEAYGARESIRDLERAMQIYEVQ
ncbi:hypothetical protein IAQ61_007072 [Plenodomus lingam]|uniref:Uncharacterized protein n=1 Tax=Leptosphaeria maculans (strain JN3 / isolate v23.1.3 / race Av1-4-5-6-7-8) TaxID=985895 RepID=E5A163_LEPMJ|nr:hypothetical protein LEMA_P106500.1 [Plenodomus lingam JN3]KAH9867768.1 hypothetical protein IAQ61_007072 [Plenodomus lingam]CBX97519.1 hypothetical protein LEMA_P106500.1 [Plenodomus lingam JN3]